MSKENKKAFKMTLIDSWPGEETRYPSITHRDYLEVSKLSALLQRAIKDFCKRNEQCILDVGCGVKPYYPFFKRSARLYVGVDLKAKFGRNDVVAVGEYLPFRNDFFDVALCTQVLEHVNDPLKTLKEIHRTLNDKGILFLSTHGTHFEHPAPRDFWRWTREGLRKILTDSNFKVEKITPCGGSITAICRLLNYYLPGPRRIRRYIIFPSVNKLAEILDKKFGAHPKAPKLFTNFFAVAIKL